MDFKNFTPQYIKQTIQNKDRDIITATKWNELWNLLISQGDNNSECLADIVNNIKDNILYKNNTTEFTPTANYHPATKKYVDDSITTAQGTDRMLKSVYDTNNDGVVNNSSQLNGHPDTYFATATALTTAVTNYQTADTTLQTTINGVSARVTTLETDKTSQANNTFVPIVLAEKGSSSATSGINSTDTITMARKCDKLRGTLHIDYWNADGSKDTTNSLTYSFDIMCQINKPHKPMCEDLDTKVTPTGNATVVTQTDNSYKITNNKKNSYVIIEQTNAGMTFECSASSDRVTISFTGYAY